MSKKKTVIVNSTIENRLALSMLTPLQGELKALSDDRAKKLENSILTLGFIYPIFVWENPETAEILVLDGHQRLKVLNKLKDKGYSIPQLPVVFIDADDLNDAKLKLAAAASQFGEFTAHGIEDFFADIEMPDLDIFEIPNFDMSNILEQDDESQTVTVSEHERTINDFKEAPLPDLENNEAPEFKNITFIVHIDQLLEIEKAMGKAKNNENFDDQVNENSNGNALYFIAKKYNEKIS